MKFILSNNFLNRSCLSEQYQFLPISCPKIIQSTKFLNRIFFRHIVLFAQTFQPLFQLISDFLIIGIIINTLHFIRICLQVKQFPFTELIVVD